MDLLRPTNDLVFKLLFTQSPDLLRHMLEAILDRTIRSVQVLDARGLTLTTEQRGRVMNCKSSILVDGGVRIVATVKSVDELFVQTPASD